MSGNCKGQNRWAEQAKLHNDTFYPKKKKKKKKKNRSRSTNKDDSTAKKTVGDKEIHQSNNKMFGIPTLVSSKSVSALGSIEQSKAKADDDSMVVDDNGGSTAGVLVDDINDKMSVDDIEKKGEDESEVKQDWEMEMLGVVGRLVSRGAQPLL